MTTIHNDDFDMCCGSRPHVFQKCRDGDVMVKCGICGDKLTVKSQDALSSLMIEWNKRQRSKA